MKRYLNRLASFIKDESGAEFIEYALVISIIAIMGVAIWRIGNLVLGKIKAAEESIINFGENTQILTGD